MNIRDLINKVDQLDELGERGPRIPMHGFQGGRPENREFHNVGGGNNGMNALAPALAGGALGYALANRGGQGGGYSMPPQQMPMQQMPMQQMPMQQMPMQQMPMQQMPMQQPNIAPPVPQSNIAASPTTTTNPSINRQDHEADDIKKLNDLVAQLEKTQVPEKDTPHTGNIAGSPSGNTKPDIKGFQDAVLKADPSALPKYGADGKMGTETQGAIAAHPDIAAKFNLHETFNFDIANSLIESFGYETFNEVTADQAWDVTKAVGKDVAPTIGAGMALKKGAEMLGKKIPGVNLAFSAKDAYDRYKAGDYTGAGIAGLSGVAGLVPAIGTAASLGLDAANLARDYKHGDLDGILPTSWQHGSTAAAPTGTTTQMPPGADPKVYALQQKLIAKGAKIKADGIMGPKTKEAMQQYGITSENLAESMASLRDRLARIDEKSGWLSGLEAGADALKAGEKDAKIGAKEFIRNPETGQMIRNPNLANAELPGAGQVTKDLGGGNTFGSVGMNRAQSAADNALTKSRETSKSTQGAIDNMVRGGETSSQDALKARLKAGNTLSSRTGGGIKALAGKEKEIMTSLEQAASTGNKEAATALTQIKSMGGDIEAWYKANPKTAKSLAFAIPVLGAVLFATSGSTPTDITNPANTNISGDGGGSGGVNNGGDIAAEPLTPAGPTPEQQALIDQIKELMRHDYGDDPKWDAATSHAQSVVDKYTGADPLQQAMDQGHASGAANVAQTPSQEIAAMPSMPKPGQPGNPIPGAPPGLSVVGATPATGANKDTTIPSGAPSGAGTAPTLTPKNVPQSTPATPEQDKTKSGITVSNWEESVNESDAELHRWLKIARG